MSAPPRKRCCTFPNVPQVLTAGGYINDLMLADNCVNWLKVLTTGPVSLTGFTPGCEDRPLVVTNLGPDSVTLRHMTLSAPGNRIFCVTEVDTGLPVGYSVCLRYDVSTSPSPPDGVWREIAKFVGAPAEFSGARVHLHTSIPVPHASPSATVAWDSVDWDTGGYFSSLTPTLIRIPAAGWYAVTVRLEVLTNWTVADGTLCFAELFRQPLIGGPVEMASTWAAPLVDNLNTPFLLIDDVFLFAAGDTLYVRGLQNTPNDGSIEASYFTYLSIVALLGPVAVPGPAGTPGVPGPPGPGGPLTATLTNQSGGTLPAGAPVAVNGPGTGVVGAAATSVGTEAIGLLTGTTPDATPGPVATAGALTLADWSAVTGAASLAARSIYYLALSAGQLSLVPPSTAGEIVQAVGFAVSPQTLDIGPQPPILL